jgi:hypothetical protein
MASHEAERYKISSSEEQANSQLKRRFWRQQCHSQAHTKVTLHLMFGIMTLFRINSCD